MDVTSSAITDAWVARNAVADALVASEQHVRRLAKYAAVKT